MGTPVYYTQPSDRTSPHARRPFAHSRTRPFPRARRTVVHAEPRRPRRRSHQGGKARQRRRHPRLGPALPEGLGRKRHRRVGLLPLLQPRQEIAGAGHRPSRRPAHRARTRRTVRCAGGKLQGRRPGEIRPRLGQPARGQPAPHLLLDHRLRPGRPLRRARRLRLHRAGHGRPDERHRRARRRARRRAAEGRRGGGRYVHRHVRHGRRPGGADFSARRAARASTSTCRCSTPRWRCWPTRT